MDTPRLLVLRVWPEPDRFRALVRELEPERQWWFTDPEALLAFLRARPDAAAGTATTQRPPPGETA